MLARTILIILMATILVFIPSSSGYAESGDDTGWKVRELEQRNQELERRLAEEETAHYLTKAKYQILEEKLSRVLFDSLEEREVKAYLARQLEEVFLIRLFEEEIPWDTHEVYIILQIFWNFPKEVRGYFLEGASPVLTIKMKNPDQMITKTGMANGLYEACIHTISLNRNVLRGSWYGFPSEILVRKTMLHELGHAYDRSRALAELKSAFNCNIPAQAFYSVGNEEYKKLIANGGNVKRRTTFDTQFDTQEELIIENFGEVFEQYAMYRKRESLPTPEAKHQYDFFYREVFCREYLRVLGELKTENAQHLRENPSFISELRNTALELTASWRFCG